MKKSKRKLYINKIQILKKAVKTTPLNEDDALADITGEINGLICNIFGNSSHYITRIDSIVFTPQTQIILNSGPRSYQGAWKNGINKLYKILIEIEQQLIDDGPITKDEFVIDPNKATIAWLQKYVPSKVWYSFFLSLTASFLAGVSIGYYMGIAI